MQVPVFFNCCAAVFFILLSGCNSTPEAPEEETIPVRVFTTEKREYYRTVQTSGRVDYRLSYNLSFKTGGIISSVLAGEGKVVEKGELLATLDLSEIRSRENQAVAALEKAERDKQRVADLFQEGAATREQVENAKTAYEIAKSDLQIASFNRLHSSVYAPSRGKVLRIMADENELVAPGQPVILLGCEEQRLVLKAFVSDRQRMILQKGDSANVSFDALAGEKVRAVVSEMAPMADPYTGMYEVKLDFPGLHSPLMPGFIGKAAITSAKGAEFVSIPPESLAGATGKSGYIFLVEKGKARRRNITIDRIYQDRLLISAGISHGDTVIVEGAGFVRNDDRVRIVTSKEKQPEKLQENVSENDTVFIQKNL